MNTVHCPKCGCEFELSVLVRDHLEAKLRAQLQPELDRKVADATIAAEERGRRAAEELRVARAKLADAAAREAALLRSQREYEERAQQADLELERRLAAELSRTREQDARLAAERAERDREALRLRDEEHRHTIEGMQRHIDELQRKVVQGSQQTQGEAQEVMLRNLLMQAFAADEIDDVPRGMLGADLLQRVRASDGKDCGAIIWESKRTKAWSSEWLAKLREDQRSAGASLAVLVTQALPPNVRHFTAIDGVWVCAWPYATALAAVLRSGLIEVTVARRAAEGRGEKMQMLFEYLTGPEFRNRVEGLVEALAEMHGDLEKEKRAMLAIWKRRERQLERARNNLTAFYGDLRGISGRQLSDLPLLSLESVGALPGHLDTDDEASGDHGPVEPSLATRGRIDPRRPVSLPSA